MKKVLFASTALVLSAGVASADGVTITGEAGFGITSTAGTTTIGNYLEYFIGASVATDSGITVGASSDLATGAVAGDSHDREVYMSYEGLKLSVGNISNAADDAGIADVGYGGLGVDNVAEGAVTYGGADVRVDYSFGDWAVAVSADSGNGAGQDDWAIGFSGSISGVSIFLGLDDNSGVQGTAIGLGYSAGAVSVKASYEKAGAANSSGISVGYTSGDVTVTAAYAQSTAAANDAYGIGVSYDLGGATLDGGFAEVGGASVMDLGINFTF